jgi:deoxyribonuclease-4
MDCVQIFTKNSNQWRATPLTDEDVRLFKDALQRTGVRSPCGHTSYLLNLASPDDALWRKSLDAFVVEIERAEALGLIGLVLHPGSHVGTGETRGLRRIAKALNTALRRTAKCKTPVWLENTAGQGTCLGSRFEHLAYLLDHVTELVRLGVCIDTCHTHAAGYGLKSVKDYDATFEELDRTFGIRFVRAFHLNDSKREQGSHIDRHEKIGAGHLGLAPFRRLLNDARFADRPMYLETPKGEEDGTPLDAINLATLRRLSKHQASVEE